MHWADVGARRRCGLPVAAGGGRAGKRRGAADARRRRATGSDWPRTGRCGGARGGRGASPVALRRAREATGLGRRVAGPGKSCSVPGTEQAMHWADVGARGRGGLPVAAGGGRAGERRGAAGARRRRAAGSDWARTGRCGGARGVRGASPVALRGAREATGLGRREERRPARALAGRGAGEVVGGLGSGAGRRCPGERWPGVPPRERRRLGDRPTSSA